MSDILVIGSINMDLVVRTSRLPNAGETISGSDFHLVPGGKGANQAVAASRSGAKTSFIGSVGDDPFGKVLLDSISKSNVDISHVRTVAEESSGTATIIVEQDGENRIIIVPGANGRVEPAHIDALRSVFQQAKICILQFELPLQTVFHTIKTARQAGCRIILNPAPAYPIPAGVLPDIDIMVLNESEISMLSGIEVTDIHSSISTAQRLLDEGVNHMIVTLGAQGAVYVSHNESVHVQAIPVEVVDTTAAGDSFVGAFSAALLRKSDMKEAVEYAVGAGSLAVTRLGAQPSIPTREEITQFLSSSAGAMQRKEINHHW